MWPYWSTESLTEPRRPSEAEAVGRPRPSESPPTHQEAPPHRVPPTLRPRPCALAQVGKRRSAGAQPRWSRRPAVLPAQLAAASRDVGTLRGELGSTRPRESGESRSCPGRPRGGSGAARPAERPGGPGWTLCPLGRWIPPADPRPHRDQDARGLPRGTVTRRPGAWFALKFKSPGRKRALPSVGTCVRPRLPPPNPF